MVPRNVNRHFTGRSEILERLRLAFFSESQVQKTFVIAGDGGIGKSEICLKFAHMYREKYATTFNVRYIALFSDTAQIGFGASSGSIPAAAQAHSKLSLTLQNFVGSMSSLSSKCGLGFRTHNTRGFSS